MSFARGQRVGYEPTVRRTSGDRLQLLRLVHAAELNRGVVHGAPDPLDGIRDVLLGMLCHDLQPEPRSAFRDRRIFDEVGNDTGLRQAASYHQDRLRQERIGYFYDVITNGFGAMQGYAEQVPVRDRWLIASYVRVLQFSQNASINDVPAEHRADLEGGGAKPEGGAKPPAGATEAPPAKH